MPQILAVDLDEDLYLQVDLQISEDEFRILTVHIPTDKFHNHVYTKEAYVNLVRDEPVVSDPKSILSVETQRKLAEILARPL